MKRSEELKQELERKEEMHKQVMEQMREQHGVYWINNREVYKEFEAIEKEMGLTWRDMDELKFQIRREENREIEVGDGVTYCLYSDKHACTVIARTKNTLTIQQDKATLDPNFKPEWVAGGFAGHCTNANEQSYTYERNPNGTIYKCHWSEKYGRFQCSDGSIRIIRGRHEYYDYNY